MIALAFLTTIWCPSIAAGMRSFPGLPCLHAVGALHDSPPCTRGWSGEQWRARVRNAPLQGSSLRASTVLAWVTNLHTESRPRQASRAGREAGRRARGACSYHGNNRYLANKSALLEVHGPAVGGKGSARVCGLSRRRKLGLPPGGPDQIGSAKKKKKSPSLRVFLQTTWSSVGHLLPR